MTGKNATRAVTWINSHKWIVRKLGSKRNDCPSLANGCLLDSITTLYCPCGSAAVASGGEMFAMEFESSTPSRGSVLWKLSATSPLAVMCRFNSTRRSIGPSKPPTTRWVSFDRKKSARPFLFLFLFLVLVLVLVLSLTRTRFSRDHHLPLG